MDQLASVDLLEKLVRPVMMVNKDHLDRLDLLDSVDPRDLRVNVGNLENLEHLGLMDNLELMDVMVGTMLSMASTIRSLPNSNKLTIDKGDKWLFSLIISVTVRLRLLATHSQNSNIFLFWSISQ